MDEQRMIRQQDRQAETFRHGVKQLIYLFSHDLRNPLVNMKALLSEMQQLLKEAGAGHQEALDVEMPEVVALLAQSVARVDRMIGGANEIYHCMFDELACEEIDLGELVARVVARFRDRAGIEFTVGVLPKVYADPLALTRIIEQLLRNAVNATEGKGGVISLTAERRGAKDLLIVRDTGSGVSGEDIERLFDPFYSRSGEGMGLAIVKALAEAHGGRVWCESGPEAGSTFYVELPQKGS